MSSLHRELTGQLRVTLWTTFWLEGSQAWGPVYLLVMTISSMVWRTVQWCFGAESSCLCDCFRCQEYNRKQFEKSLAWNKYWSKREKVESAWKHFKSKVSSSSNWQVEDTLLAEISWFEIWFGDAVWGYEWGGLAHPLPCDQLVHHHLLDGDPDPHHILEPLWAAVREDDLSKV